jgi:hypothetical protein
MNSHDSEPRAERRARRSLHVDAWYCGAAGAIAVALASPLGRFFHVPALLVAAVGAATLVWAVLLTRLARAEEWRRQVTAVGAANSLAAIGVLGLTAVAPTPEARLLLAAVALEVGAFALVQLRSPR